MRSIQVQDKDNLLIVATAGYKERVFLFSLKSESNFLDKASLIEVHSSDKQRSVYLETNLTLKTEDASS